VLRPCREFQRWQAGENHNERYREKRRSTSASHHQAAPMRSRGTSAVVTFAGTLTCYLTQTLATVPNGASAPRALAREADATHLTASLVGRVVQRAVTSEFKVDGSRPAAERCHGAVRIVAREDEPAGQVGKEIGIVE
jgi:hypothetical protein